MKHLLLVISICFLSFNVYSEVFIPSSTTHDCRVNETGCVRLACESMGAFSCKRESELKQIVKACRGNYGTRCLKQSMNYLTYYEYNDLREMLPLVKSCQGVYDLDCPKFMCKKLGHFVCGKLSGIIKANKLCREN